MDSAAIDALLPPWMQAIVTLTGVAAVFGFALLGKIRDPGTSPQTMSRAELAEVIASQQSASRDVLVSNRELFAAMRDYLQRIMNSNERMTSQIERIMTSNEDIARIVRDQLNDARTMENEAKLTDIATHVAERILKSHAPNQAAIDRERVNDRNEREKDREQMQRGSLDYGQ